MIKLRGSNSQGTLLWPLLKGSKHQLKNKSLVNEENALILHTLVKKGSEENTSEKKVSDDEPLIKKLKFLIPTSSLILSPTPLKSIIPKPAQKPDATTMTIDQFTEHLSKTTSSIFSPTPLRELTPPRDESKGKGIATEEPLKEIMPYIEEGVKEMKRLADLKAEKEKSEKSLHDILNPAIIRAQAQKMAEYEGKRKKMLDEYNHQISHRVDQLPITKISYRVNSSKEASMRIIRGNDPLNLTVYEKFRLKTPSLKAKFEWILTQAKKLGVPPPPELSTFGISVDDGKRKRTLDILQEVFVKENIVVDGMQRNLIPPSGIEGSRGRVIRENLNQKSSTTMRGTPEGEEIFKKMKMTIEAGNDVDQARKIIRDNLDGLGQDM
ncbi:hypothetical protein Tco_0643508 [Tanacetum coccineum]